MTATTGIALAFAAMLGWGIGDFMIQKNARRLGDWETLFVLTAFGALILLPFTYRNIAPLFQGPLESMLILLSAGLMLLASTLLNFEAFKKGKISVLEPLYSIEIVAASVMAFFVLGDHITWLQGATIAVLVVCLFMVSFRETRLSRKIFLEKGVFMFAAGSFILGFADFLIGWGGRVTDPIMSMFATNLIIAVASGLAIVLRGKTGQMVRDIRTGLSPLLTMAVSENIAWVAYAVAMTLVPIAIATGLSESSIVIAVLLGIFVGKERLQRHQKIGLVGAIVCALALAVTTAS